MLVGFHLKSDYVSVIGWGSQYWQCWGCCFAYVVQPRLDIDWQLDFSSVSVLGLHTAMECSVLDYFSVVFMNEWLHYKNLIYAIDQYNNKCILSITVKCLWSLQRLLILVDEETGEFQTFNSISLYLKVRIFIGHLDFILNHVPSKSPRRFWWELLSNSYLNHVG